MCSCISYCWRTVRLYLYMFICDYAQTEKFSRLSCSRARFVNPLNLSLLGLLAKIKV